MDAETVMYFLVDGDGHHQMLESEVKEKIFDLVVSNPEVKLKRLSIKSAVAPWY